MNGEVTERPMFDATLTVLAINRLELDYLEWYQNRTSMSITINKNYRSGKVGVQVFGLPHDDIPVEVYEDLLDNAIRHVRREETTVKQTTRMWLARFKKGMTA